MIRKLTTIEGLGGTGKTHQIGKVCKYHYVVRQQVIYLTYNRTIAQATRERIKDENVYVSTIHSLIYRELKKAGQLPLSFGVIGSDSLNVDVSDDDFSLLERTFLSYFSNDNSFAFIRDNCVVIVDEYQNVSDQLLKVLKLICAKQTTMLYLVGDRYQSIYGYRKGNSFNTFEVIESVFEHEVNDKTILRENHRSNASVLALINQFIKGNLKVDSRYLYKVDKSIPTEKQDLLFFTNRREEFDYVKKEAIQIHEKTGKNVAILSRAKRSLRFFDEWKESESPNWLIVSSIHKYIGNEAEEVFIVGFEKPKNTEEAMVYYTGLIRAKNRITLTSSFPAFEAKAIFCDDTLQVTNCQKKISKPFKALKLLKENRNLTRGKFRECMIDSITLAVREDDVPFVSYFERQVGLDSNHWDKSFITRDNIPIKVKYNCSSKGFFFEMKDVNLLRSNSYTDSQVIKFLCNYVLGFFGYQIRLGAIHLHSLDLCSIVEQQDNLVNVLEEGNIRCKNIMNDNKERIDKFSVKNIEERTVYFNFTSKRSNSLTMAVYRPIDKRNKNRYFDPKAIKIELRMGKEALNAKYAFGADMNMEDMLLKLKEDTGFLGNVFGSVFGHRTIKKVGGF